MQQAMVPSKQLLKKSGLVEVREVEAKKFVKVCLKVNLPINKYIVQFSNSTTNRLNINTDVSK